ncbi:MAG: two-component sensor histidine kinase [Comamonadaceae bacterium]|nr:MAG: two-component sensor histidine kinase [Comamonadaceae bacterium]
MRSVLTRHGAAIAAWAVLTGLGCAVLAQRELSAIRESFETDARIVHRLLSQRVVQHDAVLATLALLQPDAQAAAEQRLPAVYPQILSVARRDAGAEWSAPAARDAELLSRKLRRPVLVDADFAAGRYRVLLASAPASFMLQLDLRQLAPWSEWPMAPAESSVAVALEHGGQRYVLQEGRPASSPWRHAFHKHLAAESQGFDVVAVRAVAWRELPWLAMAAWSLLAGVLVGGLQWLRRQREERRRAEELLRLGQVARLNTLGELAAGMAHELNQPLTATLANTQAARRLLDDEPPELDTARAAMRQAEAQAKRASEVLQRMRRAVDRPQAGAALVPVQLETAARNALYLMAPEFARRGVAPRLEAGQPVAVRAEPVALEQIIHNLLHNALQALDDTDAQDRSVTIRLASDAGRGVLTVDDNGPGIPEHLLPRVFEPFFSTRSNGLGLGLSLCETLAAGMGGELSAAARPPHGASFTLRLPLADAA